MCIRINHFAIMHFGVPWVYGRLSYLQSVCIKVHFITTMTHKLLKTHTKQKQWGKMTFYLDKKEKQSKKEEKKPIEKSSSVVIYRWCNLLYLWVSWVFFDSFITFFFLSCLLRGFSLQFFPAQRTLCVYIRLSQLNCLRMLTYVSYLWHLHNLVLCHVYIWTTTIHSLNRMRIHWVQFYRCFCCCHCSRYLCYYSQIHITFLLTNND